MKRMTKKEAAEIIEILKTLHPDARIALVANNPFELLIATMLSAQTTDVQVNKVTPALFAQYPTPEALSQAEVHDVEEKIRSIGFFHTKAQNLIRTANLLVKEFGGQVPGTMEELTQLPGVGRKTTNVVLSNAFGVPAIAVDTHVFRVSNRLRLSTSDDVLHCERDLQHILDPSVWSQAHHLLIFHGRRICKAQRPLCETCPLIDHCRYERAAAIRSDREESR